MDPETLAFEELDDPRNNIPEEGQRAMEAAKQAYAVVLGQCSQPVSDSPHHRHGKESRSTPT